MFIKKLFVVFILLFALLEMGCSNRDNGYVTPPVTIEGADKPIPANGDMIVLRIKADRLPHNLRSVKYDWKIFDQNFHEKNMMISEDGKSVYFGTGVQSTRLLAVVEATFVYYPGEIKVSGLINKEIIIGSPSPNPGPSPTPTPDVTVPDGNFGLTKIAYDAVGKVSSTKKKDTAAALANNYLGVASQIAAGALKSTDEAFAAVKSGNKEAITKTGASINDWQPWDDVLRHQVYTLYSDGKLKVLSDYADAFKAIGDGLDLASKTP